MKTACFIPIKAHSERVPGKNLRVLNGKKLYQYICENVKTADVFDAVFIDTNSEEIAIYWYAGNPVNYRPGILPRSQDMGHIIEETTGLYGISKDSLDRYRCRIGRNPYIYIVDKFQAVDINTEEDLKIAEYIGKVIYGL